MKIILTFFIIYFIAFSSEIEKAEVNYLIQRGVNLSVAEFAGHKLPGVYGKDYTYPTKEELDYYLSKGLMLIRLPFRWERMQHSIYEPLDRKELNRMDVFIHEASKRNMKVILDLHNSARYYNKLIGSEEVPLSSFTNFWKKIASHYNKNTTIYGFGLSNEPKNTHGTWKSIAQATILEIRQVDTLHTIIVSGDEYSAANQWLKFSEDYHKIYDPEDNIMFEAHQYFDQSNTGAYKNSYDEDKTYENIGVERVSVFVKWLKKYNLRGFIGEYGVPYDDERWLIVLDKFLAYLEKEKIPAATYWTGGPWYGFKTEPKYCEPRPLNEPDRPQMGILEKYPSK